MKVVIKKEDGQAVLQIDDMEENYHLSDLNGKILEDFVEAALDNNAKLEVNDDLDEHPVVKLFKDLKSIESEDNEVHMKIKELEKQKHAKEEELKSEE